MSNELLRGEIENLKGRIAELEAGKKTDREIEYRHKFENLIATLSTQFVNLPLQKIDEGIDRALRLIGEFAGVDRSYIFEYFNSDTQMSNTHEWVAEGIEPQMQNLQDMPTDIHPWCYSLFQKGEILYCPRVDDLPPEAKAEQEEYRAEGIQSLVNVPMVFGKEVRGFVGFDSVKIEKIWPKDIILLLRLAGEMFANALDRKAKDQALQASEERLQLALEATSDGLFDWNMQTGEAYFSPRYFAMLGYDPDTMPQTADSWQNLIYPEDRELIENIITDYRSGNRENHEIEYRMVNRKEGYTWVLSRGRITERDSLGKPLRLIGTHIDITERKRAIQELQNTQKLESLGILAGGIAHDFNNLLSGIFGNIEMAKLFAEQGSKVAQHINYAIVAYERAKELTRQLLTFSKGGDPITQVVSIEKVIGEARQFALSGSNIHCEIHTCDDLMRVEIDEGQINQALNNILINARQAMPDGGTVTIIIKNRSLKSHQIPSLKQGKYIHISIKDEGPGISDTIISKIFDPFFTTKKQGSGLGLATSYSIITRHGGHIIAESEMGKGTTFSILLPATAKEVTLFNFDETELEKGEGRILLMDDEEIVREVGEKMLEELGYEVTKARNGEEAVKIYKESLQSNNRFSSVILDLTVTDGMGGEKTIKELLALDPQVKGIASSGYSDSPILASCTKYGFASVIAKPYTLPEISVVLSEVLERLS